MKNKLINLDPKLYLFFIFLIYILIGIIINWYIISDEYFYQSFGSQLDTDRIGHLLNIRHKWDWVGFLFTPILIFIKVLFVAACLEVGNFIFDWKLKSKQLLRIVFLAETVFLLVAFIRIIWFLLFPENLSLEYIQAFYPLSFINLVKIENIPQYLIYPLQLINVFELIYWIVLAYLIGIYANKTFDKSFGFVAKTYGVGLFAWVVLVVFISIN